MDFFVFLKICTVCFLGLLAMDILFLHFFCWPYIRLLTTIVPKVELFRCLSPRIERTSRLCKKKIRPILFFLILLPILYLLCTWIVPRGFSPLVIEDNHSVRYPDGSVEILNTMALFIRDPTRYLNDYVRIKLEQPLKNLDSEDPLFEENRLANRVNKRFLKTSIGRNSYYVLMPYDLDDLFKYIEETPYGVYLTAWMKQNRNYEKGSYMGFHFDCSPPELIRILKTLTIVSLLIFTLLLFFFVKFVRKALSMDASNGGLFYLDQLDCIVKTLKIQKHDYDSSPVKLLSPKKLLLLIEECALRLQQDYEVVYDTWPFTIRKSKSTTSSKVKGDLDLAWVGINTLQTIEFCFIGKGAKPFVSFSPDRSGMMLIDGIEDDLTKTKINLRGVSFMQLEIRVGDNTVFIEELCKVNGKIREQVNAMKQEIEHTYSSLNLNNRRKDMGNDLSSRSENIEDEEKGKRDVEEKETSMEEIIEVDDEESASEEDESDEEDLDKTGMNSDNDEEAGEEGPRVNEEEEEEEVDTMEDLKTSDVAGLHFVARVDRRIRYPFSHEEKNNEREKMIRNIQSRGEVEELRFGKKQCEEEDVVKTIKCLVLDCGHALPISVCSSLPENRCPFCRIEISIYDMTVIEVEERDRRGQRLQRHVEETEVSEEVLIEESID